MIRIACCLFAVLATPASAQDVATDQSIEIRMIANMGVMISQGESKVLIDALFTDVYGGRFRVPSTDDRAAMISGDGEFSGIDAVLFTHVHGDHFDAGETRAIIAGHSDITVVLSEQSGREVAGENGPVLSAQYVTVNTAEGSQGRAYWSADGLNVETRALFHTNGIENISYAVSFGETTFLHLGDTNPDQADFSVWDGVDIDVVLYPVWFAQSEAGRAVLAGRWADARHIALHVPARISRQQAVDFIGSEDVMVEAGERITILPGDHD